MLLTLNSSTGKVRKWDLAATNIVTNYSEDAGEEVFVEEGFGQEEQTVFMGHRKYREMMQ